MIQSDTGHSFAYELIGEFHSETQWIHPARTIHSFELIMVLEGTVFMEEDKKRYILSPNQMLLLEPGKMHGGFQPSQEKVSFYWFHFTTDLPIPFKTYTGEEYYEIKEMLKKLLHITNTPFYSPSAADALAFLIFEELRQLSLEKDTQDVSWTHQIAQYIKINARRTLTVSEVARHFRYNTDYMGKLFKKNFHMGLKEYIARQMISQAKDLLLTTDLSVKEIACRLGYDQENLFIKFFLYHEKTSPSAFRNRLCNTHMNNQ